MNFILDEKTLCDLECILDGYFYPLTSFMNKQDWKSVCNNLHLNSGDFFPLPITLAVDKELLEKKEYPLLILCDSTKAINILGWKSNYNFDELVNKMVEMDCK